MARGRGRDLTPEEALDPRSRPTLKQLFDVIHAVNPTDRGLSAAETSRRYALKARLQSLVVRKHAHAVVVEPEVDGVIGLRHTSGDRDLCHAVLAQLDEDARSWVRLQLDTAATPALPMRTDRTPELVVKASGPLADVDAALEAYDYEAARTLLDAAHAAGDAEATAMLVELLVDTLADDIAALTLDLPANARPEVRARLAVAAARSGDPGRALRLLTGLTGALAAEGRLALARAAIGAGQLGGAARFLALAREGHPGMAGIAAVEASLEAAKRQEVAPLEDELKRTRGDLERALPLAERIIEGHPDNELARAVLREVADGRKRAARETERAEARAAEEESQRRAAEALAQVRASMEQDLRAGLAAWLALDPRSRAGVTLVRPELGWLADAPRTTGARASELADAAIAATAAAEKLGAARPAEAAAAIREHLERVPALVGGRSLLKRIEAAVESEGRTRAQADLNRAAGLCAADPAAALSVLAGLDPDDLPPAGREQMKQLQVAARAAIARGLRARSVDSFAADDPMRARDEALALARDSTGDEARGWNRRADELQAEVQRRFRVQVWDSPEVDLRDWAIEQAERTGAWLTADGQLLVLASVRIHQVLVRIVEVESRAVVRAFHLVIPRQLDRFQCFVDGDAVWLSGRQPGLLHVGFDGTVLGWWDLEPFVGKDERFLAADVPRGSRICWLRTVSSGDGQQRLHAHLLDLDRRATGRHLLDLSDFGSVDGMAGVMGAVRRGQGIALFHHDGSALRRWDDRLIPHVRDFVIHPEKAGAFVVLVEPILLDRSLHGPVAWVELDPSSPKKPEAHSVEETIHRLPSECITSLEARATFVTARGLKVQLVALVQGEDGLEEAWSLDARRQLCFVGDNRARYALVLYPSPIGPGWQRLGCDAIRIEDGMAHHDLVVPGVGMKGCTGLPGKPDMEKAVSEAMADLINIGKEDRTPRIAALASNRKDPRSVLALLIACRLAGESTYGELVQASAIRFPRDGILALLAAAEEGGRGEWIAASKRLRTVDVAALPEPMREHLHHVRGLAAWHTGDVETARGEWTRGMGGSHCPNDALAELAAAQLGPCRQTTVVGRLATAIAHADERLAANDPRGAIAAVDAPGIWITREYQAAARRATAWLRIEAEPGSTEALRKLIALSMFREVIQGAEYQRGINLPVPSAWSKERLDALDAEVAQTLGEPVDYEIIVGG